MKHAHREPIIRAGFVLLALAAAIFIVRRTANAPGRDQAARLEHHALGAAPAPRRELDGPARGAVTHEGPRYEDANKR